MRGIFDFLRPKARRRTSRQETGEAGERAAERFLKKNGFRIVARNVTYPQGEVDLVALEKRTGALCFVEVRSRAVKDGQATPVSPEESAKRFVAERRAADRVIRFDVIAVRFAGEDRKSPDVRHYPGAFDAGGRTL
jgi:putative endonuclease